MNVEQNPRYRHATARKAANNAVFYGLGEGRRLRAGEIYAGHAFNQCPVMQGEYGLILVGYMDKAFVFFGHG